MLSYRHTYHAGNCADVLKHIVLVELLQTLRQKTAPFAYIDTHAGAGRYYLKSAHAQKNAEYADGIGKLTAAEWPELAGYFAAIQHYNPSKEAGLQHYPGSPAIASYYLRQQDHAWLFEKHLTDYTELEQFASRHRKLTVSHSDGFAGLLSVVPPVSRRGLILIDPSYELKSDYEQVVTTVVQAHQKFATGIYAIWYPVLERAHINKLEARFKASGIKKIQLFELGLTRDYAETGMTATGMIVINPPWTLMATLSALLPKLARTLGKPHTAFVRHEVLVGE